MKKLILMACAAALSAAVQAVPVEGTPKLSLNKNNIKVWTYPDSQNPVMMYKAETTMNVSIEQAAALVLNIDHAVDWVPFLSQMKLLSSDDKKGEFLLYMVLDFPFPLKDRDLVVQGKMSKDAKGVITIQNKALKNGYPLNSNYVRLTQYEGDWSFQKLGPQKVKVITSGYANPEGSIPLSVVNMFVQQQPYQMLQKMKAELAKPQTQSVLPAILK